MLIQITIQKIPESQSITSPRHIKALALPFFNAGFAFSSSELSSLELDSCFLTSAFWALAGVPKEWEHDYLELFTNNSAFGASKMTYDCFFFFEKEMSL